jgi:hypothetical protein
MNDIKILEENKYFNKFFATNLQETNFKNLNSYYHIK